ncbi:hypothetical protein F0562_017650 [Nyssa sinensis]|uniref:Uncharacterized protein n=1 Tax=Nyssa sinensis TaxID=561372 RepID=A0A5J4ZHI1_9ASTE|nr:hypothetical protein F0562_017650 [Nyssa sinensis]
MGSITSLDDQKIEGTTMQAGDDEENCVEDDEEVEHDDEDLMMEDDDLTETVETQGMEEMTDSLRVAKRKVEDMEEHKDYYDVKKRAGGPHMGRAFTSHP